EELDANAAQPPELPETGTRFPWSDPSAGAPENPLQHALELRPVPGFEQPIAWLRLRVALVAGEENSPLVRTAFVSDMTYSVPLIGKVARRGRAAFALPRFAPTTPDPPLTPPRPAEGEWICLDSRASYGPTGAGTAFARFYDARGTFGHSSQSLLVRGIEAAPARWREAR